MVPCPPGSVSLHRSYTMHGAGPNLGERPRRAYVLIFRTPSIPRDRPWIYPWMQR